MSEANTITDISFTPGGDLLMNANVGYYANSLISNTSFTVVEPTVPHILTIHDEQSKELVRIHANGHVSILTDDVNEAAKIFWQAIHFSRPRCPNCNSDLRLV